MSDVLPLRRLALLIDAENMKPEYLRQILPHVFALGRPVIQYAYADFSAAVAKPWVEFLRKNVMEARQVTPASCGKNAADIALVVDAMDLALRGRCDAVCIVSSDRDFVALTLFLRREGIDVYGFGKAQTDKKYRQSCAKFFEVKDQVPAPVVRAAPAPVVACAEVGTDWAAIRTEIARLGAKQGWVKLQTVGCELGKRGLRSKDYGGANWAQVLSKAEGFELRADDTGRRSVRVVGVDVAA